MLNTDYKIIAKKFATHLKKVLPTIIGEYQTGFIEGRQIHTNIRKTIDIVSHIYQSGKKAVIICIDFEKCFDRVEHNSIFAAMRYFNFGEKYISWVKALYTDFLICTQNAGYISQTFKKTRGLNQGCNYSPFCYNICGEIMAQLIHNNPFIKGINLGSRYEANNVISQFADDTALFLMYTESCINNTLQVLAKIESSIGLKVSYEKTTIHRIGSLKNSNAEALYNQANTMVQWRHRTTGGKDRKCTSPN